MPRSHRHAAGRPRRPLARPSAAAATAVAVALVVASPACGGGYVAQPEPAPEPAVAAGTAPPTTAPDPAASRRPGGGPVGRRHLDLTDDGRGRALATDVRYPAYRGPGGEGAEPATGVFPLVVMAHGFRLDGDGYGALLDAVAARGYVVATPEFPGTAPGGASGRGDLVNQPADVAAVIDRVVALAGTGALPPVAPTDRVAVMGHSDGGLTAAALAYNDRFRDRRVRAAVVLSGGMAMFPGNWSVADPPPLLAVHGTVDETNPLGASERLVDAVPAGVPRALVLVDGGDHVGPYRSPAARTPLGDAVADFLDAHLAAPGDGRAMARFRADAGTAPLVLARDE